MHWPVKTSLCDVKPRFHVMWLGRKLCHQRLKMLMFAFNLDMLGESQNGKNFVETSVRPHIF